MRNLQKTIKPIVFLIAVIMVVSYKVPADDTTPIGTVIHSIMPPSYFMENHKGWILLEGQKFTPNSILYKSQLYQSLLSHPIANMDSLPDSRGMFLRSANYNGGVDVDSTRVLGHPQSDATRLSNKPMTGIGIAKNDSLSQSGYKVKVSKGAASSVPVIQLQHKGAFGFQQSLQSGYIQSSHEHNVEVVLNNGGDLETRPRNISLYTYIKIN